MKYGLYFEESKMKKMNLTILLVFTLLSLRGFSSDKAADEREEEVLSWLGVDYTPSLEAFGEYYLTFSESLTTVGELTSRALYTRLSSELRKKIVGIIADEEEIERTAQFYTNFKKAIEGEGDVDQDLLNAYFKRVHIAGEEGIVLLKSENDIIENEVIEDIINRFINLNELVLTPFLMGKLVEKRDAAIQKRLDHIQSSKKNEEQN